jgi:hypothetical protein
MRLAADATRCALGRKQKEHEQLSDGVRRPRPPAGRLSCKLFATRKLSLAPQRLVVKRFSWAWFSTPSR